MDRNISNQQDLKALSKQMKSNDLFQISQYFLIDFKVIYALPKFSHLIN